MTVNYSAEAIWFYCAHTCRVATSADSHLTRRYSCVLLSRATGDIHNNQGNPHIWMNN